MAIGAGTFGTNRTVIQRLPVNPMDRSTIVTLIPKMFISEKPTLFPGKFAIPAAKPGDFELFIVEPSSYFLANATERMPPTEVPVNSAELAKSIVLDYCVGILECNMADRMPGLFWIPGQYDKVTITKYVHSDGRTFQQLLEEARQKQRNWYMALVSLADLLWSRSQNPRAISDDSRLAAEFLQFKDKPWMQDMNTFAMINCKYCGELINPLYPVCKHCHAIIDPKKAKELDIQFAAK